MFIDEVKIKVIAWKWGDWLVSWRREKYIPKWWPWGWDGWNGWNVYLQTDYNLNTLSDYRHKKVLKAKDWQWGWTNTMHWANWEDLILKVPVWTIVRNSLTNEIIFDLDKPNTRYLIARGWRGWYWNCHFVSSTRQAPWFAELWDIPEEKDLHLELKLVADIGIIWIPSAWKSTLIWNITNVKPKIWDYPFTTITPNLWVLDHKWKSLVLEDVPWLIPWASSWKWLWNIFLKHIERTWVVIHLLDLYRLDKVFDDYTDIRKELEIFSQELANKEEIIVFSKADLLDSEMKEYIVSEFRKRFWKTNKIKDIFVISSATWEWVPELIDFLIDNYSPQNIIPNTDEFVEDEKMVIYDIKDNQDNDYRKARVNYIWDLTFEVSWKRLEQIVRMTDFYNMEAVMRVYNVLDKMWVIQNVEKKLSKIIEEKWIDNSFFFEWSTNDDIFPKIIVAGREISLDKLKYKL